jgi:hypothetical protein
MRIKRDQDNKKVLIKILLFKFIIFIKAKELNKDIYGINNEVDRII